MSARLLDAAALRAWAHAALDGLIAHTDEINRLNVFPVADADTGTNMLFTMRSACVQADAPEVADDLTAVTAALAEGALRGARGNSGVILSQILRGLSEVAAESSWESSGERTALDAASFTAALRHAVGLVVASLGESVSGTILSVLQAAAAAAETVTADGADLAATVIAASDAAAGALERTTHQLDVLAAAGVVDAGGRGLLVLLDAMTATITGYTPHRRQYEGASAEAAATPTPPADHPIPGAPQFEVMYLLSECDHAGVEVAKDLSVSVTPW